MSKTAATKTAPQAEAPENRGELLWLTPDELKIGDNVRKKPDISDLVESIRDHGILVPLTGRKDESTGEVTIREGQRRLLTARELGLSVVPVFVKPFTAEDEAAQTNERVSEQIITNEHRAKLPTSDLALGVQEMLTVGKLKHQDVADRLHISKAEVAKAAKVGRAQGALEAADDLQLSMEEAVILAEFEGNEDAVAELREEDPSHWKHTASRLRAEAKRQAEYAKITAPYAAQGFTILDRDFYRYSLDASPQGYQSADNLTTADGAAIDVDTHITPNVTQWAVHLVNSRLYVHMHSGDVIPSNEIDWRAKEDESSEDGKVHRNLVNAEYRWCPVYYTNQIAELGLKDTRAANGGSGDPDQDAEARRHERRRKIELNKHGDAAIEVRREWIKNTLLSKRTPPKGAVTFIARQLIASRDLLHRNKAEATANELLGKKALDVELSELPEGSEGRATVILLGQVLGALEAITPRDAWSRKPGTYSYSTHSKEYLTFLAAHGYQLSEIEQVITGDQSADDLYEKVATRLEAAKETAKALKAKKKTTDVGEDSDTDTTTSDETANVA